MPTPRETAPVAQSKEAPVPEGMPMVRHPHAPGLLALWALNDIPEAELRSPSRTDDEEEVWLSSHNPANPYVKIVTTGGIP